jgi:N-hydroxyarylamine O-acetyltransferase
MGEIDCEAYFRKVRFAGPAFAELRTLQQLQPLHTSSIPFENLDPLVGRSTSLAVRDVAKKFLIEQRGGYCFEQNIFFQALLRELGFKVSTCLAVVQWNRPPSEYLGRNHMILLVHLPEGAFLVDVGYGRLTLTSPLALVPNLEQQTTLETFRLVPIDRELQLQVKLPQHWAPVYQFLPEDVSPHEHEVQHWYTATHPKSLFRTHLMVARPTEKLRYGLFDNDFSVRYPHGTVEKRKIQSADELIDVLSGQFLIQVPEEIELALMHLAARWDTRT